MGEEQTRCMDTAFAQRIEVNGVKKCGKKIEFQHEETLLTLHGKLATNGLVFPS